MRELSVVGPAPTPSSVCTHCLSGSCDQPVGTRRWEHCSTHQVRGCLGQLLQVIKGEELQVIIHAVACKFISVVNACKERQVTVTHCTHVNCSNILEKNKNFLQK